MDGIMDENGAPSRDANGHRQKKNGGRMEILGYSWLIT